jgi:acetylornithine deacetylase/succinyl-diaminopimelate desuccinylase-like protein
MAIFRCSLALLIIAGALHAAPKIDWAKVNAETIQHFTNLLRIDTTNPPGNETRAAEYIQAVLAKEGIPSKLLALEPERANLVARIKGNGKKRPVLVMGHTDVVGVQRDKWIVDPFAAIQKDGYMYARGATDDKDNLTAGLMLMLLLKRARVKLERDIIFLAESGEEGSVRVGIEHMVNRHWNEIDAEFALAEGGYIGSRRGDVRHVAISTTEKVPRGITLVARGTAGHGSRPVPDNAVVRIANAVAKVGAWQPPMRLNDTTRTYFERLAMVSPPDAAARYRHIVNPSRSEEIQQYFWLHEPAHHSMLRTSIAPTIIEAGFRTNVIPSEAEAYLDVRALPDENMNQFAEHIRGVINDPKVEVRLPQRSTRPAASPSRLDTEMFQALERAQRRLYPGAITLPTMLTGATDMAQLRARGVQSYGIGPIVDLADGGLGGAHSDNERLAVTSMENLVQFLWAVILEVAAAK